VPFLPNTRRLFADSIRLTWGFESIGSLAHQASASYAVRVPRARSLPTASFKFGLAANTLAVRLEVPVIKASIQTSTDKSHPGSLLLAGSKRQVMTLRLMLDAPTKKGLVTEIGNEAHLNGEVTTSPGENRSSRS